MKIKKVFPIFLCFILTFTMLSWGQVKANAYDGRISAGGSNSNISLSSLRYLDSSYREEFLKVNNWTIGGNPVKFNIGGKEYSDGIAFDMNNNGNSCYVDYNIGGGYKTLSVFFGTDIGDKSSSKTQISIYGDNKLLYRSMFAEVGREPISINVNIERVETLRIYFNTEYGSYPVFASALLSKENKQEIESNQIDISKLSYKDSSYRAQNLKFDNWIVANKPVKFNIGGEEFNKGLAVDMNSNGASCYIDFNIDGKYKSLSGLFGTDVGDKESSKTQMIISGDGKEIYRSMFVEVWRSPIAVNVDIERVKVLRIYFNTEYGSYPVFANATLSKDKVSDTDENGQIELANISHIGSSYRTQHLKLNNWIIGKDQVKFKIGGKEYKKGIAFDMNNNGSNCYISYNLDQKYDRLKGVFGTDSGDKRSNKTQIIIYGDGKELYKSPFCEAGKSGIPIDINLKRVKTLKIYFNTENGHYPVLADAVLIKSR